jgi:hypothetical protein
VLQNFKAHTKLQPLLAQLISSSSLSEEDELVNLETSSDKMLLPKPLLVLVSSPQDKQVSVLLALVDHSETQTSLSLSVKIRCSNLPLSD